MNSGSIYKLGIDRYSYLYLFMIILYAGQPFGLDSLVFAHSINLSFIIPPVMTVLLLMKNRVDFGNKQFLGVLLALSLWFGIQYIYRRGAINITLTLYHYYQLVLCFIIVQVFREKLFAVYEDIVYKLAVLSLVLWSISLVIPHALAGFFNLFGNGTSISEGTIYVYSMMRLDHITGLLIRNAGFAWEPGRYSCFLCLAILCNLLINKYELKRNKHLLLFVIALFTTQSTTGIFTLMVLMAVFLFNKNVKHRFLWLVLLVPIIVFLFSLDFAGNKLNDSMSRIERAEEFDYVHYGEGGYALDRIESFVVEWNNFLHDPVLGYCESRHSSFEKMVGEGFYTNNGTMHMLAKYGILGLLYYFCIYISSKRISRRFRDRVPIAYLLLYMSISMSYNFDQIVLIMAFSFWGIFVPPKSLQDNAYSRES